MFQIPVTPACRAARTPGVGLLGSRVLVAMNGCAPPGADEG
jgi:hypothetical protein